MHDLRGDEHDRECDRGLDRRTGHVHPAQRRREEREAVRDRECGDGRHEPGPALIAPILQA
jgi:hypothetical protein